MLRYLLLSFLIALIAAPLPARADGPAAKDVAAIGDCLRKQDGKRGSSQEAIEAACLMVVARPCTGDESAAADRRRIDCLDRERLVWEGIVAQSDAAMMKALDPDQQTKLRAMQQAWSRSRELSCGFWYDYFEGTMANPMIASCNNREAARRAIFLRVFAADLAGRK
ncbi:MAG TPA: lysozyme inhibitor LprI family protein [Tardiphaga sp.]